MGKNLLRLSLFLSTLLGNVAGLLREKVRFIKSEFLAISLNERFFVLFAMLCGFCITAEYAITKPTSGSIFIAQYGVKFFPYAWLAIIPLNLLVVSLYNRFLFRISQFGLFFITIFIAIFLNCFVALFMKKIFFLAFFLYVWKDLYCLLMFQQLWSQINAVTPAHRAKYLYGVIFGVSGCGALWGSAIPAFFAVKVGSERLLFMTLPVYAFFALFYYLLLKRGAAIERDRGGEEKIQRDEKEGFIDSLKLVLSSQKLKSILFMVVIMQFSATVIEYQFNTLLAKTLPNQDVRTEYYGKLWGIINAVKICLQFFASFLLIHLLGTRRAHFFLPTLLFVNTSLSILFPHFSLFAYSFGFLKALDYSLFNVLKEMLYLSFSKKEKFQAKPIIDVFAYRSAKALASLFVIGLECFFAPYLPYAFSWGPFLFFLLWLLGIYRMLPLLGDDSLKSR